MSAYDQLFDGQHKIWNMPAGEDFLYHLAKGLSQSLKENLQNALILLPTRRAARSLSQAFLELSGGKPLLLPRMRTLADLNEDEPPFTSSDIELDIPPALPPDYIRFELARLVKAKYASDNETLSPAGALAMTEPLERLLIDMAIEEINADDLKKLDEIIDFQAGHFQDAAKFATIIAKYWPQHMQEIGLLEPTARKIALLNAAAMLWQDKPPQHPVIIAGSTGSVKATARLMKTVSLLPKGMIVLPGLDNSIDDKVWDHIDEQHPQYGLKLLLQTFGVSRATIPTWPQIQQKGNLALRRKILSHALIPADMSYDWPNRIKHVLAGQEDDSAIRQGLQGLRLIEAMTQDEEASIISLIMRGAVEDKKTCVLVTPDPALARRVRASLSRWDIEVDSSAGEPLEETLHGSFMALSLALASDFFDVATLISLVRHPLFSCAGGVPHNWPDDWPIFEKRVLRKRRPSDMAHMRERAEDKAPAAMALVENLYAASQDFRHHLGHSTYVSKLTKQHIDFLQYLAGSAFWEQEAGEKCVQTLECLIQYGDLLGKASGEAYAVLLSKLMRGQVVRPRYGTQTGLSILGPMEARMQSADISILGSLNEGTWPATPAVHPMLSTGMRKEIGLSSPERRLGQAAHDFEALASRPEVYLTRAKRDDSGPTVLSRWLWRLMTLTKGATETKETKGATENTAKSLLKPERDWSGWAQALDPIPTKPRPAAPPAPCPPVDKRWPDATQGRRLSVTKVKTLIRDPYAVYATKILGLYPVDAPGYDPSFADFGTAMHKGLERFVNAKNQSAEHLYRLLNHEMNTAGFVSVRNEPRLRELAEWFVNWRRERRQKGWQKVSTEDKGVYEIAEIDFSLSGVADLIEKDGSGFEIIDYKSGTSPSVAEIKAGFDPQLPLLALMLAAGAFKETGTAKELSYVKPRNKDKSKRIVTLTGGRDGQDIDIFTEQAFDNFKKLIRHFDDKTTAYHSQPRAKFENPYGEYDHLARRAEWAVLGEDSPKDNS